MLDRYILQKHWNYLLRLFDILSFDILDWKIKVDLVSGKSDNSLTSCHVSYLFFLFNKNLTNLLYVNYHPVKKKVPKHDFDLRFQI